MALIKEIDYGTPIRVADQTVTLTIDGMRVSVPAGTSLMAAAMQAGTQIPKLCATDSLEASAPAGSASSRSRDGAARPPPAPRPPRTAWWSRPRRTSSPSSAKV
jgi:hypothetical protein